MQNSIMKQCCIVGLCSCEVQVGSYFKEVDFNQFLAFFPISYPLKTPENKKFSVGTKREHWPEMGNRKKAIVRATDVQSYTAFHD